MSSACPFAKGASVDAVCPMRSQPNQKNAEHEDKGGFAKACSMRAPNVCHVPTNFAKKIERDKELQVMVDRFIDGHARIKRSQINTDAMEGKDVPQTVIYGDVSMECGSFLVQQAMKAFSGQNIESAKSRLSVCAQRISENSWRHWESHLNYIRSLELF